MCILFLLIIRRPPRAKRTDTYMPYTPLCRALLLKVVGEGIGIVRAFEVASCARILVPAPGAADVAAPLERARSESQSAHAVEGIEAAQAAADDRDIELKSVVTSVERGGNVAHVVALLLSVWWRNADRPVRRTQIGRAHV